MKAVTIYGNTYRSVAAAWREVSPEDLTLEAVRWRLREGWSNEDAFMYAVVPPTNRRGFKELRQSVQLSPLSAST